MEQTRLQFVGPRHQLQFLVCCRLPSDKSLHVSSLLSVVTSCCTGISFVSGKGNGVRMSTQMELVDDGLYSDVLISNKSRTNVSSCRSSSSEVRGCSANPSGLFARRRAPRVASGLSFVVSPSTGIRGSGSRVIPVDGRSFVSKPWTIVLFLGCISDLLSRLVGLTSYLVFSAIGLTGIVDFLRQRSGV
jgi:hypothetical protein